MTATPAPAQAGPVPLSEPLTLTLEGVDLRTLSAYRAARHAWVMLPDELRSGRDGKRVTAALRKAEKDLANAIYYLSRVSLGN
ncbi:hypothetical protein D3C81_919560 [compost metagenome]